MKSKHGINQAVLSIQLLAKCAVGFLIVALVLAFAGISFENHRGKADWEKCKADLLARGEHLYIMDFVPPPVPDDKNFALTPLMKPLLDFVKDPNSDDKSTGGHTIRDPDPQVNQISVKIPGTTSVYPSPKGWMTGNVRSLEPWQDYYRKSLPSMKLTGSPAEDVLTVLGRQDALFAELRGDLQSHPLCRYPLHYELVFAMQLPHLTTLQNMTKALSLRSSAELQEGRSDEALADLQLGYRLIGTFRDEPTLIDGLVRITTMAILMQSAWEGIAEHRWNTEQLAALEKELRGWDFLADFNQSMRMERGCANWLCEKTRSDPQWLNDALTAAGLPNVDVPKILAPAMAASMYRNQILINTLIQEKFLTIMDSKTQTVNVAHGKDAEKTVDDLQASPYTFIAKIMMPVYIHVEIKFAQTQIYMNEAIIACEIERYRLANGKLPATLDDLHMQDMPLDVITGQPLRYRVVGDDNYLLYSVGWNETDDGGKVMYRKDSTQLDPNEGDWVWSLHPL